jgi:Zinc carboxypeptidase
MPGLAFDHFYGYDELTSFLRGWADERPQLVQVESIGRSWEKRDIWLVTLTNLATGAPLDKPGFLVEANIHSVEWTGSMAALHLIQRLAEGHGSDERVTRLLDTRCMYVVPRLNPDGAEHALREGRFIRSSVRPYPAEEPQQGLRMGDVDGDGRMLFMRIRDPNGPWKPYEHDPRLLVARDPDEVGGEYYRLFPEGEIEGHDGVTVTIAPALEGLDLGMNLPADYSAEPDQPPAGPYTGSEPEISAYLRAVVERPNLTGFVSYHTFGGVHLRPPLNADDDLAPLDLRAFRLFGEKATELTGYPAIAYEDLKIDPREKVRGGDLHWFYDHLGVFAWLTEFWNPLGAAGIGGDFHYPSWLGGEHPIEDDVKLLRWSDDALGGNGFVEWYEHEHPQLGTVELGGWDKINYWYNAPFDRLEQEVAPHTEWVIFQALASPLLEARSLESEAVAPNVHRVRLVLQNSGWLPTYVSKKALSRNVVGPIVVDVELPEEARLLSGEQTSEVGQLEGRIENRATTTWWGYEPSTTDLKALEWIVEAPLGGPVRVTARHPRAGTVRAETILS